MRTAIELIQAERSRQISIEGWTPVHDDAHEFGELAAAASCYAKMAQLLSLDEWDFEHACEIAFEDGRGAMNSGNHTPTPNATLKKQVPL